MGQQTARPEPGIATDKELETAADALWDAIEDTYAYTVDCDRFDPALCDRFDPVLESPGSEVITVHMEEGHRGEYAKTQVINAALQSEAPIKLHNHHEEHSYVTFYPTNQD
jgi:hypothetical protein